MTVSSSLFNGLDPAQVTNVLVKENGFGFGSLTLNETAGQSATIGSFLTAAGVSITTNGFSVNYSTGAISGAITATIGNLGLFPNGNPAE